MIPLSPYVPQITPHQVERFVALKSCNLDCHQHRSPPPTNLGQVPFSGSFIFYLIPNAHAVMCANSEVIYVPSRTQKRHSPLFVPAPDVDFGILIGVDDVSEPVYPVVAPTPGPLIHPVSVSSSQVSND